MYSTAVGNIGQWPNGRTSHLGGRKKPEGVDIYILKALYVSYYSTHIDAE